MDERREFVRLDLSVEVKWKTLPNEETLLDKTKNLSAGGICIMVDDPPSTGSMIYLEINLPDNSIIHSKGKVVWAEEYEEVGEEIRKNFDVGVQFVDIDRKDQEKINYFIFKSKK